MYQNDEFYSSSVDINWNYEHRNKSENIETVNVKFNQNDRYATFV